MLQMIGIILCSLLFGAQVPLSIDLQYHTANYREIEWSQFGKLGVDQVTIRTYQDLPDIGGLYFMNGQFKLIQDRLNQDFLPVGWSKRTPKIIGWLISRKYNWIDQEQLFDTGFVNGKFEGVAKLDLFNPEAVELIVKTFTDLVSTGVSGVLIQDDLMIRNIEGFSSHGLAAYTRQMQVPAEPDKMVTIGSVEQQNWNRIKINQVNQVVRKIVNACKAVNPDCRVAMNVYYEVGVSASQSEAWYAHSLPELLLTGLDEIVLMAYHRQMAREWGMDLQSPQFRERYTQVLNQVMRICGERVRVKFQIRDWQSGERISVDEIQNLLQSCQSPISKMSLTPVKPGDLLWVERFIANMRRKTS